jgi:hypothetical protein
MLIPIRNTRKFCLKARIDDRMNANLAAGLQTTYILEFC